MLAIEVELVCDLCHCVSSLSPPAPLQTGRHVRGAPEGAPPRLSHVALLDVVADAQAPDQAAVGLNVLLLDVGEETPALAEL